MILKKFLTPYRLIDSKRNKITKFGYHFTNNNLLIYKTF